MIPPIVSKELSGISRRWQTYAARGLYVGLIAVAVFRFWREVNHPGTIFSLSDFAHLGRRLFDRFLPLQMTFVTLASISGAADAISREGRSGTLGLLLLTSLDPAKIAFGKWQAVMAQALSLVLCGVPVLAIGVYLGGVGTWEVLWSAALTLSTAAVATALTLNFSATSSTGTGAMFLSIGTLAGSSVGPALIACFGPPGLGLASILHPAIAAATAAHALTLGDSFLYLWIPSTLVSALLTRRLLLAAAKRIGERAQHPPRPRPSALRDFATSRSYFGRTRRGRRVIVHAGVWERFPLLWKELAGRPAAALGKDTAVGIVFLFFLFLIVASLATGGQIAVHLLLVGLFALVLALVNGAGLFVHEREGRKMDLLLTTPLTAWGIVRTKLAAGVVAPESLIVLGLGACFSFAWGSQVGVAHSLMMLVTSALALGFAYVLAASASLYARTLRGAFLFAAGTVLLLYGGAPWLGDLLFEADSSLGPIVSPAALLDRLCFPSRRESSDTAGAFALQTFLYGTTISLLLAGLAARVRRIAAHP